MSERTVTRQLDVLVFNLVVSGGLERETDPRGFMDGLERDTETEEHEEPEEADDPRPNSLSAGDTEPESSLSLLKRGLPVDGHEDTLLESLRRLLTLT